MNTDLRLTRLPGNYYFLLLNATCGRERCAHKEYPQARNLQWCARCDSSSCWHVHFEVHPDHDCALSKDVDIPSSLFRVGDVVMVRSYNLWYGGTVEKVTKSRVRVSFERKHGGEAGKWISLRTLDHVIGDRQEVFRRSFYDKNQRKPSYYALSVAVHVNNYRRWQNRSALEQLAESAK